MLPKAIIVDIDGTVAHRTNREPFEYDKVLDDRPDHEVIEIIKSLWTSGYVILFVSAREDYCFDDTHAWLMKNCPPFAKLFMRKSKDFRRDAEAKKDIYLDEIKPKYDVFCVFDDRNQVVEMWRELGLKCLQVGYGDF